jgi:hypothetical protein
LIGLLLLLCADVAVPADAEQAADAERAAVALLSLAESDGLLPEPRRSRRGDRSATPGRSAPQRLA